MFALSEVTEAEAWTLVLECWGAFFEALRRDRAVATNNLSLHAMNEKSAQTKRTVIYFACRMRGSIGFSWLHYCGNKRSVGNTSGVPCTKPTWRIGINLGRKDWGTRVSDSSESESLGEANSSNNWSSLLSSSGSISFTRQEGAGCYQIRVWQSV